MSTTIASLRWTADDLERLASAQIDRVSPFTKSDVRVVASDLDVWDAWPLADVSGQPIPWREGELWFALTVSRSDDPETRHHLARIHHFHHIDGVFHHLGQTLPEGFAPGSRQWSGSARYLDGKVTLYFTASGEADELEPSYKQRLFATTSELGEDPIFTGWSKPSEILKAEGRIYQPANQAHGQPGKIKAFRDPAHFRDRDGQDYVLFTGSSAREPSEHDGVVGLGKQEEDGSFTLLPPLVEATGVNNELERPHIIENGGRLYLFWCTQRGVFAPGIIAPSGLYGATADTLGGPWELLNGHGLVFANPVERPTQAYSWWVLPDQRVTSFVDYWGPEDPSVPELKSLRDRFGGTFAPFNHIWLDGAKAGLVRSDP